MGYNAERYKNKTFPAFLFEHVLNGCNQNFNAICLLGTSLLSGLCLQ